MALSGRVRAIILSSVILIVGIIHLGVGIGITAKYRKFGDTFQQQVSLSGYNIFIGLCAIAVGIVGLVAAINQSILLSKVTAITSFILGIFTLASLITALALSGNAASYLHKSVTDNMNSYVQDQDSIDVIDLLQTTYECCGVNLWLDWARISLGVPTGLNNGRRRRKTSVLMNSPLTRALRRKRQVVTSNGNIYNLPSTYTVNLPLSCCKAGGVTPGNSLGVYCTFDANNNTNSFYVGGCLEPVANIGFSQITGIAVINTWLTILAFVYFAKLIVVFRDMDNSNNEQGIPKEIDPNQQQQQQQQQQYPYDPNYMNYGNPNAYYFSNEPYYKTYM